MLERVVGKGRFFRSADLTLPRESDGRHPTPMGGAQWADAVAHWLVDKSHVPIAMNEPTRKAAPPKAKVFPPPYKVPDEKE